MTSSVLALTPTSTPNLCFVISKCKKVFASITIEEPVYEGTLIEVGTFFDC